MGEIMEIKKNKESDPPGSDKSDRKRSHRDPLEGNGLDVFMRHLGHPCVPVCICFENRNALGEVIYG